MRSSLPTLGGYLCRLIKAVWAYLIVEGHPASVGRIDQDSSFKARFAKPLTFNGSFPVAHLRTISKTEM